MFSHSNMLGYNLYSHNTALLPASEHIGCIQSNYNAVYFSDTETMREHTTDRVLTPVNKP